MSETQVAPIFFWRDAKHPDLKYVLERKREMYIEMDMHDSKRDWREEMWERHVLLPFEAEMKRVCCFTTANDMFVLFHIFGFKPWVSATLGFPSISPISLSGQSGTLVRQGFAVILSADANCLLQHGTELGFGPLFVWLGSWPNMSIWARPKSLGTSLKKDPPLELSLYDAEVVAFLSTHRAPFRRFPEQFLCLVGISRYYDFDENTYPAFLDMILFSFIRHADPTKVRIVEVQKNENQVPLLESTRDRVVSLEPPVIATEASGGGNTNEDIDMLFDNAKKGDAGEVVVEQPKVRRKRKLTGGVSGSNQPPKKLKDDYHALVSPTEGKSLENEEPTNFIVGEILQTRHPAKSQPGEINLDVAGPSDTGKAEALQIPSMLHIAWTLRPLVSATEAAGAARTNELKSLQGQHLALKKENAVLADHVTQLTFDLSHSRSSCGKANAKMESLADEQEKVLNARVTELGAQCLKSPEYLHALESKYVKVMNALSDVDFPLLSLMESKKDASMEEVMNSLRLEANLAEPLSIENLVGEASTSDVLTVLNAATTLSTTFAQVVFVVPLSSEGHDVAFSKPALENPALGTIDFEKEYLVSSPKRTNDP
nr:transposase (putative), gypsy type [Tanacetum cinerariifolium]